MFCGPTFGLMRNRLGPGVLANLLFGEPVVQAFPTTAAGLASALGDAAATPSYIWDCQESSGNLIDEIASEALVPSGSPLQGQTAVGLGSTRTNRNAVEFLSASSSEFATADNTLLDVGLTNSVALVVSIAVAAPSTSARRILNKRGAAQGYIFTLESNGRLSAFSSDNIVGKIANGSADRIDDGARHTIALVINRTTNVMYVISEMGVGSVDISAQVSLTNTDDFTLGAWAGSDSFPGQMSFVAAFEGAAAEAIDLAAIQAFHAHATDPTPGQLLTTQTRGSLISCPVADGYVAHYADDTIPTAWHAGFSDTDKLGILTNSALTNLLLWSEDFTNAAWTKTTMTVTANNIDSPDGFRSADKLTAGAANDYIAQTFVTTAATQYTLSYWPREETVGATGRLIFYDETGAVELASQVFTCDGTWEQRIDVTATTNGGQISSSFRVEIDTSGESINAWGTQVTLGDGVYAYIRTTSTTSTLAVGNYEAAGGYVSIGKGEIATVSVPTVDTGAVASLVDNSIAITDQRYTYLNASRQVSGEIRGGATSEDIKSSSVAVALGSELVTRHLWDVDSSSLGYETIVYQAGTAYNGAALPYEQSHGAGFTGGIQIGATYANALHYDGIIQSIISYDGPLPL